MAVTRYSDRFGYIYELKDIVVLATNTLDYRKEEATPYRCTYGHVFITL
jgi:hypothetical protein